MQQRAEIRVMGDAHLGEIDPRIYGQNIEHLGRQVLGGLVAEPGSKASQDSRGFRDDVWEAVRELSPSIIRWPGGCFADSYRWPDGIGKYRPRVKNRMWGRWITQFALGNPRFSEGSLSGPVGPLEDNRFGTAEFMELCRVAGAEPYITVSLGQDDPGSAAAWVSYVRETCGKGPRVFSVGNEQWNPINPGATPLHPDKYVDRFRGYAAAMRDADPEIKLTASAADAQYLPYWNKAVLQALGEQTDYLSLHLYLPAPLPLLSRINDSPAHHYAVSAAGLAVETQIKIAVEQMHQITGRTIPIAFDEWNILGPLHRFVFPHNTLREAIGVAGVLHAFHRQCAHVRIACMFAMINSASPPIVTDRDALARTPVFHVLRLYRGLTGPTPVFTQVDSPTVDAPRLGNLPSRRGLPLLDVSATLDNDRLTLFVINRDHRASHEADIELLGVSPEDSAEVHTVTATGYLSPNRPGQPELVTERVSEIENHRHHVFPPCSVTALVIKIK